jgi:hypothetical protein
MHQRVSASQKPGEVGSAGYSPRISRSRRLSSVIRSFIFSDSDEGRVFFFGGAARDDPGLAVTWQYAQPVFNPCLHSVIESGSLPTSYQ